FRLPPSAQRWRRATIFREPESDSVFLQERTRLNALGQPVFPSARQWGLFPRRGIEGELRIQRRTIRFLLPFRIRFARACDSISAGRAVNSRRCGWTSPNRYRL